MVIKQNISLKDEIRRSRGQTSSSDPTPVVSRERKKTYTPYEDFLKKYANLEETIDNLGTRDLVYYFREIAQEQGFKYTISNIKKDMAIMKKLKNNYSNREICGMIEFLYLSGQTYIDRNRCSINLLASNWINTIYADMKLWVDDKYSPKKPSKSSLRGEWTDSDDSTIIGGEL